MNKTQRRIKFKNKKQKKHSNNKTHIWVKVKKGFQSQDSEIIFLRNINLRTCKHSYFKDKYQKTFDKMNYLIPNLKDNKK